METLPQYLLQEIQCPVCLELMIPPITQCENGHNICSSCKSKLENCPSCRAVLTTVRNLTAENLSRKAQHPCKFRPSGCVEELQLDLLEQHEDHCLFKSPKCPFHIVGKCFLDVPLLEMKDHIKNTHTCEGDCGEVTGGTQSFGLKGYTQCRAVRGAWWQAVFTLEEVFFLYATVIDNLFYVCYMFVGPEDQANSYKYRITLTSSDGDENASMCRVCPSFLKFMHDGFRNASCAVFPITFAHTCFTEEDILPFEYEIFVR